MPIDRPLTRRDMDVQRCIGCGKPANECPCSGAYEVHQACHPESHLEAVYVSGVLVLRCAVCKAEAIVLAIAEGAGPREPVVIDVSYFDA
jgi:hypothetical protein